MRQFWRATKLSSYRVDCKVHSILFIFLFKIVFGAVLHQKLVKGRECYILYKLSDVKSRRFQVLVLVLFHAIAAIQHSTQRTQTHTYTPSKQNIILCA